MADLSRNVRLESPNGNGLTKRKTATSDLKLKDVYLIEVCVTSQQLEKKESYFHSRTSALYTGMGFTVPYTGISYLYLTFR